MNDSTSLDVEAVSTVDPITVSVIQHRLSAIVEEMGEAMLRTSYSQILNSSRDFSTALCGADGALVAQLKQHAAMAFCGRAEPRDDQKAG